MAAGADTHHVDLWRWSWWQAAPDERPQRSPAIEVVVLVVLGAWNVTANLFAPEALEVPLNLLGAAALVGLAHRGGLSWATMGVLPARLRRGLAAGAVAGAVVVCAVVVLTLVPATRSFFADDRFLGMPVGEMLYDVVVRIPLGTSLGEEVAFRGVVFGMLMLWLSPLRAALVSSALFGLWHVLPGISALDTSSVDIGGGVTGEIGAVLGQVLVTGVAGLVFCWIRLRGRHVAAPWLAHWALNGSAFVAGWLTVRNGWA